MTRMQRKEMRSSLQHQVDIPIVHVLSEGADQDPGEGKQSTRG